MTTGKSSPAAPDRAKLPRRLAERIEIWAIERLVPYGNNPRQHDDRQVLELSRSIERYGFLNPILVNERTGVVVAGHGRLAAAHKLGLAEVPVVPLGHLTDAEQRAYLLADNRLAELSTWDEKRLEVELRALATELPELPPLGFTTAELDRLLEPEEPTPADIDQAGDAPPEKPVTRKGDLWEIGSHRILCGDSRLEDDRARILGGAPVELVLTDPPYAVYGSSTGVGSDVADDRMVRDFFETVLRSAASSLRLGRHAYIHCDWRSWSAWWEAARGSGLAVANMVVWDKKGAGLGSNWSNSHELVCFLHRVKSKRSMWDREAKGVRSVLKPNVLRYSRAGLGGFESTEPKLAGEHATVTAHNAAKPVELLRELVTASTDTGERVLDLFGGSGSTLLACELAQRVGLLIEIEPKWVDVAIGRATRLTGKPAALDGKTFADVCAERSEKRARRKGKS